MIANRDIHPGDIIFHDQAAVVGPDPGSLPMCLECHALVRIHKKAIANILKLYWLYFSIEYTEEYNNVAS